MTESNERRPVVLFVDDEVGITDSMRLSLRRAPYDIRTANSAAEGLDLLEREAIDVVVSDERMPEMPGSRFLTIVRERHPDVMRIILTGHSSLDATIAAINEAAVFRFLSKPVSREDLRDCIDAALEARRQREAARRPAEPDPDRPEAERFAEGLESLWIAFQPLLSTTSRRTIGYEALLRTESPRIQGPTDLIGLAERFSRVTDLEARIHEAIARDLRTGPDDALFFVNLHPLSLCSSELFEPDHPLVPFASRIVLEITERASLEGMLDLEQKVAALRHAGFRIAVDDLGAGYAGLTSFAQLDPDFVKFDMSLVRDLELSSTRAKLIRSMTVLCQELGVRTVGEGVETPRERDLLAELECDVLQGFYHGRPAKPFSEGRWEE